MTGDKKALTSKVDLLMPEIRKLYIIGRLGTSEIARRLGLNVKTVAIRLGREGLLRSRKESQENRRAVPDAKVMVLYNGGEPINDIVKKLGVDYQSVFQVLHRNGIEPFRMEAQARVRCGRRLTSEEKELMCSMYGEGYHVNQISARFGVGTKTVSKTLKQNGIQVTKGAATHTARFLYSGRVGSILMRSTWEVEIAQMFDFYSIVWKYEPKTFTLSTGQFYTPDFYLPDFEAYVEVKGGWTSKAIKKFEQFTDEYPDVTVFICRQPGWFGQFYLLRKLFEKKLGHNVAKMSEGERTEYICEQTLMLYAEIAEVLQEIPWKKHKVYENPANRSKYLSELVDVLVFVLNLLAAYNADEQDIIKKARTVELKNFLRQRVGYRGSVGEDLSGNKEWSNIED